MCSMVCRIVNLVVYRFLLLPLIYLTLMPNTMEVNFSTPSPFKLDKVSDNPETFSQLLQF